MSKASMRLMVRLSPQMGLRAALLCMAAALSGCGTTDRIVATSVPMEDYHVRHPIVLAETAHNIDIFPSLTAQGLDVRSAAQVREFAADYRANGHGPVTVLVPSRGQAYAQRKIEAVRAHLAQAGIGVPVQVTTYSVINPSLASPIRLSFIGTKAEVAHKCGQWPNDLASGSSIEGWENKPYWNLGCTTQAVLAAQVADPRDLVEPTADDPADTILRSRSISQLRKGSDPITDWKTKNTSISNIGSN
jgi:pilus assembly protein CpaD